MLVCSLKLFFFLCVGFVAAFPIPATEPRLRKSVPSCKVESRHTEPAGRGNKIFASAQWERSFPSRVREARDPQSTIFNHNQWDDPDQTETAPRSSSLIFAHAQWEERGKNDRDTPQNDAERSGNDAQFGRKRRDPISEGNAGTDVDERKDISTGPVFFAHGQWEETP
ncbi:hypothetical protein B0H14DRAFT_2826014 [Mycena olivaceomarginata]|nr:hypothetical protein B0H14DRAFT_2826014 [Mycena olivaceomarginata]